MVGDRFWSLTPFEFDQLAEGSEWRETHEWWRWRELIAIYSEAHRDRKKNPKKTKGSDIFHLPLIDGEKAQELNDLTQEQRMEIVEKLSKKARKK